MRSYHLSGKARRRGQALLLAVLIMIFAALLSAAFIGIVAANLNQTARQSDKNRSVEAANAGLKYVNDQLTNSPDGDRWRTEMESIPPAPGDDSYNFYYTPMEIAQGWARTTPHPNGLTGDFAHDSALERLALDATRATGKLELVKIPDPRVQPNAPNTFLTQVQRVSYNSSSSLAGSLKVTVIGVSPDDPTAFHRIDAYKGGYKQSPLEQVMRVVCSYDFNRNSTVVAQANPIATLDGTTSSASILQVNNAKGDFSKLGVPFPITLSDPKDTTVVTRTAVVTQVATVGYSTFNLTLATPLTAAPKTGERVDLAADFGGPDGVDLDNTPSTAVTAFPNPYTLSDTSATALTNQVDGARVNNSLIWSGALAMARLRPLSAAFGGTGLVPGTVWASSVIAPDPNGTTSQATAKDIGGTLGADTLKASDDSGIFSTALQSNQYDIVSDGWGVNKGVPAGSSVARTVREFHPPSIDTGASLQRYRNLARYSLGVAGLSGTPSAQDTGALYGYGQGIYIDNPLDKEKVYDGTKLRDMTQSELTQMWLSQLPSSVTTTPDYLRTGTPAIVTDANDSLEQKHLRGWVGADEFRGRGVEIELGNNSITVTRDSRSDAIYAGGDPAQTWKDPSTGNAVPGRYTEVLKWPTNGVIFAEGNIRIKGNGTNVANSLTVVSMGNIYIEDSISAAADDNADADLNTPVDKPRKILLMAKRNVVMNPTRLLGRPDQQTRISGTQTLSAGTTTITVADPLGFKRGDFIQTGSTAAPVFGYVTLDPAATATALDVNIVSGGAVTDGDLVFTPNSGTQSLVSTESASKNVLYNTIGTGSDVIQRRLNIPANAVLANLRVAFNHQATRIPALQVEAIAVPPAAGDLHTPPTMPIFLANKGVFLTTSPSTAPYLDSSKTVLGQNDRTLTGQYTEPPPAGTDKFPGTNPAAPTTEAEAVDTTRSIGNISTSMNSQAHTDPLPTGVSWTYQTSVTTTGLENLPFFYLAGVGNLYNFDTTTLLAERRPQINTAIAGSTPYVVPLATSVGLFVNGVNGSFTNENWNASLATPAYDKTFQFGFRPSYLDSTTLPIPDEDILTGDQSFYQTDPILSTLDSRSTYDATALGNGLQIGDNVLVLRQTTGLIQPTGTTLSLPAYRLLDAKLENVTEGQVSGVNTISAIAPAHTFNINAYVYAQTGSWFVISGPLYDDRLRGDETKTFLDTNNNGVADFDASTGKGEYIKGPIAGAFSTGDYADLNRNGVIDDFEKHAMARFSRFNYSITFTGAIAENQTPLINNAGTTAIGAVNDWTGKWTTTAFDGTTTTHDRIKYIFDPTVVSGKLEDDPTTPAVDETDYGFRLPQTSDLFNVS